MLYQLLHNFSFRLHTVQDKRRKKDIEQLKPLLNYVSTHYAEHISIDEAAAMTGFEPKYFCRFFKNKVGATFLEYQNDIRLGYAFRDIVFTDDSIQSIMDRHGFTNPRVFHRLFRERFGMTAREMRQKNRADKKARPAQDKSPV